MTRRTQRHYAAPALIALLVVTGCTVQDLGASATEAAESSEAAVPSMTETATLQPETTEIVIGGSIQGVPWLPFQQAAEELRAEGWTVEFVNLASGDLVVQAVASGDVNFGAGAIAAMMLATTEGAPLQMILDQLGNQWGAWGKPELEGCESLDGVKFGVHSFSSLTYLFPKYWIDAECPGTEPEWIILPGSENRLAALLAGELDATTMELSDQLILQDEAGDEFAQITDFRESLPNIITGSIYGNSTFMEANPNTTTLFVAALVEEFRELMADEAYFNAQMLKFAVPGGERVAEVYVDQEMFAVDGGITDAAMQESLDFYISAEIIPAGTTVDQITDRTYVDGALELLGPAQ